MDIFELYLELRDVEPKMYRTIQVSSDLTVAEFGYIVQVAFEMKASHLMKVTVPVGFRNQKDSIFLNSKERYRYEFVKMLDVYQSEYDTIFDITEEKLYHAVNQEQDTMELWYDFGDDWFVDIELKQIIPPYLPYDRPRVTEGSGYGIIEDCGGPWMLTEIIKAFKKKRGEIYNQYSEWYDEDFDYTEFHIDEMNIRLQIIPPIYKRSYEEGKTPTKEELLLIE